MIEIKNVGYSYSDGEPFEKTALENINLNIKDGVFYSLIGHTGSGKTTLIQLMSGLLKPSCGEILIDGVNICGKKVKIRDITKKIGVVFQYPEYQLFEETVFEDVAFGPKNLGCSREETEERAKRALELVGIGEETYQKSPFELSGGQKRRVAIAGTLSLEPDILILDEPTAGLDPEGRDEILGRIKKLHEEKNLTVIMVSHSMEDVARLAERVIVMNRGTIVTEGTVNEVFSESERLTKIGLEVPQISRVMMILRENKINIKRDIYTVEDAAECISQLLEG